MISDALRRRYQLSHRDAAALTIGGHTLHTGDPTRGQHFRTLTVANPFAPSVPPPGS